MPTPSVPSLLRKYRIAPRRRLGQHFLTAAPTMGKVVAALGCTEEDAAVEIGSGLGVMTALLAERAGHVFAIERDSHLLDIARKEFPSDAITWIDADILKVDLCDIVLHFAGAEPRGRLKVVGNLPYGISSPILFCFLEHRSFLERAVVMVQKEVALRICAPVGSKEYGILAVLLQAVADCRRLFDVSAKSFFPRPAVASSVVRLDFREGDCGIADESRFREIVKGAFGKRRKTLRNALLGARALGLNPDALDAALSSLGIDPRRRPETLTVDEFKRLASHLPRR